VKGVSTFSSAARRFLPTAAELVVTQDNEGRSIRFDVQAPVDVEWYANHLRNAAHGDEISTVLIRIVPQSQIQSICGASAGACYTRRSGSSTIVVPAGQSNYVAHTLLHEYAHHIDSVWPVVSTRQLDGTPAWWAARGIDTLLRNRQVAFDYSLGWNRSIAEIYAEDYAWIHLPFRYGIPWLSPPDEHLRTVMISELTGKPPTTPPVAAPAPAPLLIDRQGTLAARRAQSLPFGLLGPGRRVTYTVNLTGAARKGVRARAEIVCNGRRVATQNFGSGRTTRVLDVRNLGPAQCQARLVSTSAVAHRFTVRLRLAVESQQRIR
jgi:hypothetical protein